MEEKRDKLMKREAAEEQARFQLLLEALTFLLPEEQARQAVEAMLDALGSLSNIVAAPQAELLKIPGMTPKAVRFLYLTLNLARACLEDDAGRLRYITDLHSAVEVLRPKFLGRKTEAVAVILLNSSRQLLYSGIISDGSINAVPLYIRPLARMCIDYEADSIILSHNHLSGNVSPSQEDLIMTKQVEMALIGLGITLRDHIILSGKSEFSFLTSGLLERMAEDVISGRRAQLEVVRQIARDCGQVSEE